MTDPATTRDERGPEDRDDRAGSGRPRWAAAATCLLLFAALGVVLALTTPWRPLPGPVPGGRAEPDPARDFTRAETARSAAFDAAISPPAYAGLAVGLIAVLVLGFTPLGARLVATATARTRRWPLRVLIAVFTVTAVLAVADLPFGAWRHIVAYRYGLSTQGWPDWLLDQVKAFGLSWLMTAIALLCLYALIRRFPRYWWTGAASGGFLLVVLVSFIYPIVVEPAFNSFRPLPAGALRTELLELARADGVPVKDVLVADASRRTTALNAYVSGFGSTRRIVVYDTLLKTAPAAQIESVTAHELGHAKRNDVLYGTLVGALGVSGAVCLLYVLMTSPRLLRRAGLEPAGVKPAGGTPARAPAADPRSIALLLALVTVLSQFGGPVQNLVSRRIEARADVHALDLTRDPATFAAMQRELALTNISDLDANPVEYVLWASHPSVPERIAMARDWARRHGVPEPAPLRRSRP